MKETLKYIEVLNWGYSGFAPMTLGQNFEKSLQQVQERLALLDGLDYGALFVEATSANGKANLLKYQSTDDTIEYSLHFMRDRGQLLEALKADEWEIENGEKVIKKNPKRLFRGFYDAIDEYKADGVWTDEQWREYRVTLSMVEKGFQDRLRQFATAYDYCMEDNPEPQQEQPEQPKRGKKVKHMIDLIIPLDKELIYKRLQDKMAGASPDVAMDILIHNIKNKVILKPSYNIFAEAFPSMAKEIPKSTYYYKIKGLD